MSGELFLMHKPGRFIVAQRNPDGSILYVRSFYTRIMAEAYLYASRLWYGL